MANEDDYATEVRLPADINCERVVLGALIADNEIFFDDALDLKAEYFYLDSHRKIFESINEILFGLVEGVRHVDDMTLAEEFMAMRLAQAKVKRQNAEMAKMAKA